MWSSSNTGGVLTTVGVRMNEDGVRYTGEGRERERVIKKKQAIYFRKENRRRSRTFYKKILWNLFFSWGSFETQRKQEHRRRKTRR